MNRRVVIAGLTLTLLLLFVAGGLSLRPAPDPDVLRSCLVLLLLLWIFAAVQFARARPLPPGASGTARTDSPRPPGDHAGPSTPDHDGILQALPWPVYLVDREFRVLRCNRRAEELSRLFHSPAAVPEVLHGRIADAATHPGDWGSDDLRRVVRLSPPGQPEMSCLVQVVPLAAAAEATATWAVLVLDVTRLHPQREAETKAMGLLGHELKTPAAGLRLALHLLLEEKLGPLNAAQRELLEVGRDDCEHLLATLQALLELARLESGQIALHLLPIAPGELLAEAGAQWRQSGGEFILDLPTGLPPVLADASQAGRVLARFVANAGEQGVAGPPIELRARAPGDGYVRLSVVNRGSPLSDADQARVFEPFFRRPGPKRPGTGLELAHCRAIAALHGGRIGVHCSADAVEFFLDLRTAPSPAPASAGTMQ